MAKAEERGHLPSAPSGVSLTTPCTLQALRVWLAGVDVQGPGVEKLASVTSTASTIVAT